MLRATTMEAMVQEARVQLSQLSDYVQEKEDVTGGAVAALDKLGNEIRAAEYLTEHSQWKYESPEEVSALEAQVVASWETLDNLLAEKRSVLEDDLAREECTSKVLLKVASHRGVYEGVVAFHTEGKAYLDTKEVIHNSETAKQQLARMQVFDSRKKDTETGQTAILVGLGNEIRGTKHESAISTWSYPEVAEVSALEVEADCLWQDLGAGIVAKKEVLDDDLMRELYAEATRLMVGQHEAKYGQLADWAASKKQYITLPLEIAGVFDARRHISQLEAYAKEYQAQTDSSLASLKRLGRTILERRHASTYSEYVYEKPEDIRTFEETLDGPWKGLVSLHSTRADELADHLAREEYRDKVRLWVSCHSDAQKKLLEWAATQRAGPLSSAVPCTSVQSTHLGQNALDAFVQDKVRPSCR